MERPPVRPVDRAWRTGSCGVSATFGGGVSLETAKGLRSRAPLEEASGDDEVCTDK